MMNLRVWMMMGMLNLFLMILAYLLGSLCTAVVVCRVCQLSDPRSAGSQNPGATNVLRLHGKKYAAVVLLGDVLKGILPIVVGHCFGLSYFTLAWLGFFAVLGHMYPIFFGFQGGKGVATAFGVYLALSLWLGALFAFLWIMLVVMKRYSSLASLVTLFIVPGIASWYLVGCYLYIPLGLMSLMIVLKHRENIRRLYQGQETKVKF